MEALNIQTEPLAELETFVLEPTGDDALAFMRRFDMLVKESAADQRD